MLFAFGERLRQLRHDKNYTMGMVEDRLAQKNVSIGQSAQCVDWTICAGKI